MNPFSVFFAARYLAEDDPRVGNQLKKREDTGKDNFLSFCLDNHTPPAVPFHYLNVFFRITKKETRGKWTFETKTDETHYINLAYFGADAVAWLILGPAGKEHFPWESTFRDLLFLPIHLQVLKDLEYLIEVLQVTYHGKGCLHTSQQRLEVFPIENYDLCKTKKEWDPMLWC
jgi:hypothetical protein